MIRTVERESEHYDTYSVIEIDFKPFAKNYGMAGRLVGYVTGLAYREYDEGEYAGQSEFFEDYREEVLLEVDGCNDDSPFDSYVILNYDSHGSPYAYEIQDGDYGDVIRIQLVETLSSPLLDLLFDRVQLFAENQGLEPISVWYSTFQVQRKLEKLEIG